MTSWYNEYIRLKCLYLRCDREGESQMDKLLPAFCRLLSEDLKIQ